MFWTLLAMFVLVVTGGFISYYGDLQGRRWGKKRVSWFGLRPKHTAILITSITGAMIALLTVGAVMLIVPNVRDVVIRGEAAINDNQRIRNETKKEIDRLQLDRKSMAAQMATNEAALQEMNKLAARAKAEADKLKQTNQSLDKTNGGLIDFNMDLQRQKAGLQRSIGKNQQALAQQKRENAKASIISMDLARQNTDLGRDNDNLSRERTRLIASNDSLKETNRKLKEVSDNLQMTYDAANKAYIAALDSYQSLQSSYKDLEDRKRGLDGAYGQLKGQFDELSNQLAGTRSDFVRAYMDLRQTRYNLRADTELARRTLDAHLSPKAVKEELVALLKDASDRARQYGAVLGENGRAVAIMKKRVVTPASIQMADESASLDAIVDAIAGSNTPVVVVARTTNNSTAHEQVLVELNNYTSTTVFKQGEVVASRAIDARQPMDRLVASVILFLKEDVRNAAIKSGTIPQISPETGEEEVGMIDTPDMVSLVDRIRRMGGTVQLDAVANETLTSADLLTFGQAREGKPHNLRFDLKRLSAKSRRKGEAAS